MLKVVISFDYELFLGKNYYNSEKVLFEPTDKLLDILERNSVSATFFADVCSVFQHEKYGQLEYVRRFKEQISRMEKCGSDVQLHIHPNWLRSYPQNEQWEFDKDSYRIHYFDDGNDEEWTMDSIVKKGVNYLNDTLQKVNSDYKCIAYRAGGFAIQPHKNLFSVLHDNGIKIDSSVVVNDWLDKDITSYDFRNTPSQLNWWVSAKSLMKGEEASSKDCTGIWEVPVMTTKNSLYERFFIPRKNRIFKSGEVTGAPITIESTKKHRKFDKVKSVLLYNRTYRRLSVDVMNYQYLFKKIVRTYNKYGAQNKDIYVSLIGHPKAFTGEAFKNFEELLKLLLRHQDKIKIVSMADIFKALGRGEI